MIEAALTRGLSAAPSTAARVHDWLVTHRRLVLVALAVAQIAASAGLILSINHNGWLTYQGGDQIWLYTTGWLLQAGTLPTAQVSYGWSLMLAPLAAVGGPAFVSTLPATMIFDVVVLGTVAVLAVYDIGRRIGGTILGLWCAALWVVAPYLAIPLFIHRYHDRWVDQFLPQVVGFTQLADFPSMVTVLVAAALVLRSLEQPSARTALLAGLVAGWALALKPSNSLFLAAPLVGYVLARHWRSGLVFAIALTPSLLTLALWKQRGLGTLPVFATGSTHMAAGLSGDIAVASSFSQRYTSFDWSVWGENMRDLSDFFWSLRLAQWVPFAGAVAVMRRSRPAAGLLFVWVLAYAVVKGSAPVASVESGSLWRLVMPAWPAYVVLLASIPLLVPTFTSRLGDRLTPPPTRPARLWVVVAAAVALGVAPLAAVAAQSPQRGPGKAVEVKGLLTPVDADRMGVEARRVGGSVILSWDGRFAFTRTFYRVYRSTSGGSDATCERAGADKCTLNATLIATTRDHTYVDRKAPPGATYRIGVAANWKDDVREGDVFLLSPPVHPE